MSLQIRRVVTGHDANGRAVVSIDEQCKNLVSMRQGAQGSVIWSTGCLPADNSDPQDGAARKVATTDPNGTVFRVAEFAPGVASRNHRTESLDYGVVISGEIDMVLDDAVVHLRAGDVLVQRGTIHNWINNGSQPCVIAFILIAAKPVTIGGKVLGGYG